MARSPRLRRIRHLHFDRTTRQKKLNSFLIAKQATLNATGAAGTIVGSVGSNITWTAHAKTVGKGPFLLTTAGTLPAGLRLATPYWISAVVDANTIKLSTQKGGPSAVMTDIGSGVHTITKSGNLQAMFEHLKQSGPVTLAASTDVDNL